jgi:seryl-tRNA synthetase
MLDIRLIREQTDLVKSRLAARSPAHVANIDAILAIDVDRRAAETRLQGLQGDRNRLSKEIGQLRAQKLDSAELEAQVKKISADMEQASAEAEALSEKQREILLNLPNIPQADVPVGHDAADNPVVRTHGEKPSIENPKDHVAIAESLGLIDSERATKISGSGFAVYTGAGARLERALINFLIDLHTRNHGYTEVATPFVVRRECMVGTGQLPKFEEDMYGVDGGGLFLVPTAEVPVTNLRREEILKAAELPVKYAAYTPCFRREAGSAGRETKGLIRMHQFDKVELVKICAPENSNAELESLTADAERVLQALGLHYRVIVLCTGDMGFGSAKTYDIEVWAPGQNAYLEVSSCSNFEDYQARRMNLRFKGEDGKNRFCHTLNGSGTALARLYVALLENGQRPDGSVELPAALEPYFGARVITK